MGSNKRISELGQVPRLDGQEEIVVVQGAVTQKATIDQVRNNLTPTTIVVGDAVNIDLREEQYANSMLIKLTWDGVIGNFAIRLPSVVDVPYRAYRFITDGTFTANRSGDIIPTNNEFIDGTDTEYINKSYSGLKIWNDGVEWFVIQKKA